MERHGHLEVLARPETTPIGRYASELELVAIDMGYGHLRPAHALREFIGADVLLADHAPLASTKEQKQWAQVRQSYELLSRATRLPFLGGPLREVLDGVTAQLEELAMDSSLPARTDVAAVDAFLVQTYREAWA